MFRAFLSCFLIIGLAFPALPSFAEEDDPVVFLTKGTPAPKDGYLFSPKRELNLRLTQIELDFTKNQLALQASLITRLQQDSEYSKQIAEKEKEKAELWRKSAEESTQKYIESKNSQSYRDYGFFVAGILIPIISAFIISRTIGK